MQKMNDIAKLIVTIVTVFSLAGSLIFSLCFMNGVVRVCQGNYNATQDMVDSFNEETVETIKWTFGKEILIAFASVLGLTGVVAILKKL